MFLYEFLVFIVSLRMMVMIIGRFVDATQILSLYKYDINALAEILWILLYNTIASLVAVGQVSLIIINFLLITL